MKSIFFTSSEEKLNENYDYEEDFSEESPDAEKVSVTVTVRIPKEQISERALEKYDSMVGFGETPKYSLEYMVDHDCLDLPKDPELALIRKYELLILSDPDLDDSNNWFDLDQTGTSWVIDGIGGKTINVETWEEDWGTYTLDTDEQIDKLEKDLLVDFNWAKKALALNCDISISISELN